MKIVKKWVVAQGRGGLPLVSVGDKFKLWLLSHFQIRKIFFFWYSYFLQLEWLELELLWFICQKAQQRSQRSFYFSIPSFIGLQYLHFPQCVPIKTLLELQKESLRTKTCRNLSVRHYVWYLSSVLKNGYTCRVTRTKFWTTLGEHFQFFGIGEFLQNLWPIDLISLCHKDVSQNGSRNWNFWTVITRLRSDLHSTRWL